MTKPSIFGSAGNDYFSVIRNTPEISDNWLFHLHDAVIQTDLGFFLTGWNIAAEKLCGQNTSMGKHLFEMIDIMFTDSSMQEMEKELAISGCWGGEIIFSRYDGKKILLHITANYIYNDKNRAKGIVFVAHNIAEAKRKEKRLEEAEEALRKNNERYAYAAKVTSDAIWDLDLETNQIYRSEAFISLSGYNSNQIEPTLDWWFDKIHPDDKERVKSDFKTCLEQGLTDWVDEYRFQCEDGRFINLIDRGTIIYKWTKPVRIIGAIEDITERKQLEEKILFEEIQKQKQINQASIAAQEQERNNISEELHDNVNQILMTARLFMSTAQKDPEQRDALLQKAIEFQTLALEEIRKLSKSLNSSVICAIGLRESIEDILYNLKSLENLTTELEFDPDVIQKLSKDQLLMLYRIVQEQTNNIFKHANAKNVSVIFKMTEHTFSLLIADDGVGFDTHEKRNGVGLTNILNRVSAYNGKMNLTSSPGSGCRLEVIFPFKP